MTETTDYPLSGIRVIDFTQVMMGPSATQMLGDLGADVIKVERPGTGDLSRNTFGVKDEKDANNPIFYSLNRNKRSIVLDTRTDEAKDVIYKLVAKSDVVVSNFRPGVMDRMGFSYETLSKINSRIIVGSGSGFGPTGPFSHKGGQDVVAQAITGVLERRSDPSVPRSIYPTAVCDYAAGMHLVQGILAAIIARMKTGKGQEVEVSLYNSMLDMQMQEAACQMKTGEEINWASMPLTGVFDTQDGAIVVVGAFKKFPLRDICEAFCIPDLSPQYPDFDSQRKNKVDIQEKFQDACLTNVSDHWIGRLEALDLLCAKVGSLTEALGNGQTAENGMISELDHPLHGRIKVISSPIKLSDAPFKVRMCAPRLGEHTDEILADLGIEPDSVS